MKKLITLLFVFFVFVIDTTLFSHWTFRGIRPDLVLVLIFCLGLIRGRKEGVLWGAAGGLFQDLLIGGSFLVGYCLLKPLLGFFSGLFTERIYRENLFIPVILIFFFTFAQEILLFLLHGDLVSNWLNALGRVVFFEALFNSLLTLIFYPVLLGWDNRDSEFSLL